MKKVSKESVNYRPATTPHDCGNCAMFNGLIVGLCDLVKGPIWFGDVCNRWVKP